MSSTAAALTRAPHIVLHWDAGVLVAINGITGRRYELGPADVNILHHSSKPLTTTSLAKRVPCSVDDLLRLTAAGLLVTHPRTDEASLWHTFELVVQRLRSQLRRRAAATPRGCAEGAEVSGADLVRLPPTEPPPDARLFPSLARRRSVRHFTDQPITLAMLSDLLVAAAGVTGTLRDGDSPARARPYPSAGGRHPLELYLLPLRVDGLPSRLYRFNAPARALQQVPGEVSWFRRPFGAVGTAAAPEVPSEPALVIVVTAVVARTMQRYENGGLLFIYQELGALYQTLHLVATGLGLGGFILGGGNELRNSQALGLDPLREIYLGAFLVGHPEDL